MLRKIANWINFEKIQDEVRKLGTVLISAGSVALALDNPKNPVEPQEALLAILIGTIFVLAGAMDTRRKGTEV